jgi:hypothetical protein
MSSPSTSETWYDLPALVQEPFQVYVNGIPQQAGVDYEVVGRTLVFQRALKPEAKMSRIQWVLHALGIAGTYQKHHTVDIAYDHQGGPQVVTGLQPRKHDT